MIVQLDDRDLVALVSHIVRHTAESGQDGDLIFRTRDGDAPVDELETIERHKIGWAQAIDQPFWLRTWGVAIDDRIVGHLDLYGGRMASEAHRAMLGMGIERAHRGHGHGRALLGTAIGWARAAGLAWIDLGVFAHNPRARALYAQVGFVELGVTRDRYRVDGRSIDDVAMALKL
ncbi:MAG TPA: GNAT family N-acetyltransferase [Kofleriaceae bacterium]|nr:GNAT family N-acetyltransferase [Kofleriaceae bacterium]